MNPYAERIRRTREQLNAVPWWRWFKRQEAGREYKNALLLGALYEARVDRRS